MSNVWEKNFRNRALHLLKYSYFGIFIELSRARNAYGRIVARRKLLREKFLRKRETLDTAARQFSTQLYMCIF